MLFHPMKVLFKVISILFKVHSACCEWVPWIPQNPKTFEKYRMESMDFERKRGLYQLSSYLCVRVCKHGLEIRGSPSPSSNFRGGDGDTLSMTFRDKLGTRISYNFLEEFWGIFKENCLSLRRFQASRKGKN